MEAMCQRRTFRGNDGQWINYTWLTAMLFPCLRRIIVAGDGRYYNKEAIQIICRMLAGNGIKNIWVPRGGIMSTPAVSAAIRTREGGKADGGIVLTASHNPGGPGEDFGIKYNLALGQPAGEDFTDVVRTNTRESVPRKELTEYLLVHFLTDL